MKITLEDLKLASQEGVISPEQAEGLWQMLESRQSSRPRFDFAHVAFYLGALIVIAAMTIFMTLAWDQLGGGGILAVSLAYMAAFYAVGSYLWFKTQWKTPGGLLVTVAVCITPLAIYALERTTGFWLQGNPGEYQDFYSWMRGSWFLMELGTVIVGLITIYFVRFPFLTAPIAASLWYMSIDIVPLIYGPDYYYKFGLQEKVSIIFGIALLVIAYMIDHWTEEDFAFWLYLFGLIAFWGGLVALGQYGDSGGFEKFLFLLINILLVLLSVFLERRAFVIFGGLGIFIYFGYLAYDVFADSLLFPFALSLVGVAVIFLGILYQRYAKQISMKMTNALPERLRWLRPSNRVAMVTH